MRAAVTDEDLAQRAVIAEVDPQELGTALLALTGLDMSLNVDLPSIVDIPELLHQGVVPAGHGSLLPGPYADL